MVARQYCDGARRISLHAATQRKPVQQWVTVGQGLSGIVDRVSLGTDTTSTTFRCSGAGSAFPGAPRCSGGSVTYQFIPYNPDKVITGDPNMWYNPLMFRLGPAGFLGNAGRGILRAPGLATW